MGRRVQQTEDGVHRAARDRLREIPVDLADDTDPQLHVLPLELPYELAVAVPEPVQLTVVQGDQRAVVQREVDMAVDQRGEHGPGIAGRRRDPFPAAVEQPAADPDEKFGEHRVLAREMPVQPRPADTDGRPYLVHSHAVETTLGEEPGGLVEDLLAPRRRRGPGAHGNPF